MRLQRYLALCGVASRRKAEQLILDGRVQVNGLVIRTLGTKVLMSDDVLFDGKAALPQKRKLYLALNKPRGYICSASDLEERPKVLDLLAPNFKERLFSVGRLDFNTSGLMFFTNDGDFAKIVSHPSSKIEKEYIVESAEDIPEDRIEGFKKGAKIEGEMYRILDYSIISTKKVRIVLIEGKNREIRRLFQHIGCYVVRIHRVRIGQIHIEKLKSGSFRHLTAREIQWLMAQGEK